MISNDAADEPNPTPSKGRKSAIIIFRIILGLSSLALLICIVMGFGLKADDQRAVDLEPFAVTSLVAWFISAMGHSVVSNELNIIKANKRKGRTLDSE